MEILRQPATMKLPALHTVDGVAFIQARGGRVVQAHPGDVVHSSTGTGPPRTGSGTQTAPPDLLGPERESF
jgi:hypothetical protein